MLTLSSCFYLPLISFRKLHYSMGRCFFSLLRENFEVYRERERQREREVNDAINGVAIRNRYGVGLLLPAVGELSEEN